MNQLLLHLIGDYITQTNWMATMKARNSFAAFVHALIYSLPFLLIGSEQAVTIIFITHFFVDRFGLARYVCFAKNWATHPSLKWEDVNETGFPRELPIWLSTWLVIIVDNTLHLLCNYLALSFL